MATAAACIEHEIVRAFQTKLANVDGIVAVHFLRTSAALSVWIGLREDDAETRKVVYRFEDQIAEEFPDTLLDFHVIPLPEGRRMEDFVSVAQVIFEHAA